MTTIDIAALQAGLTQSGIMNHSPAVGFVMPPAARRSLTLMAAEAVDPKLEADDKGPPVLVKLLDLPVRSLPGLRGIHVIREDGTTFKVHP